MVADVEWTTYQQTWISHKNHAFILCVSASFCIEIFNVII